MELVFFKLVRFSDKSNLDNVVFYRYGDIFFTLDYYSHAVFSNVALDYTKLLLILFHPCTYFFKSISIVFFPTMQLFLSCCYGGKKYVSLISFM